MLPRKLLSQQLKPNPKRRPITICLTCRKRKVKCDRGKPACGRCLRLRISCHYAPVPAFETKSTTVKDQSSDFCELRSVKLEARGRETVQKANSGLELSNFLEYINRPRFEDGPHQAASSFKGAGSQHSLPPTHTIIEDSDLTPGEAIILKERASVNKNPSILFQPCEDTTTTGEEDSFESSTGGKAYKQFNVFPTLGMPLDFRSLGYHLERDQDALKQSELVSSHFSQSSSTNSDSVQVPEPSLLTFGGQPNLGETEEPATSMVWRNMELGEYNFYYCQESGIWYH